MSPLRFCAVRALVFVCLVFCTSLPFSEWQIGASGKLGAQNSLVFARANHFIGEVGLNTLRVQSTLDTFNQLIDKFNLENPNEEIAGFLFVPHFEFTETITWGDPPHVYSDWLPKYGDDPNLNTYKHSTSRIIQVRANPEQAELLEFYPVVTTGLNVFIASWEDGDVNNNERTLKVFGQGFDEFEDILDPTLDPTNSNGEWFRLETTNATRYSDIAHENNMADAMEFEVAYLPYDEYLYLTTETTYYSQTLLGLIEDDPTLRGLVIERALAGQTFDLASGSTDQLTRYRTLSIRPGVLRPEISNNMEAGIAFNLMYYCPPYWLEDPGAGGSGNLTSPPDENDNNQGRPGQSSFRLTSNTQNNVDIPLPPDPGSIEKAITLQAVLHEQQLQRSVEHKLTSPSRWSYFGIFLMANWWVLLIILLLLIIAYFIGKSS
ncbi:MAG: hypothetical protein AAF544_11650 [Bacteroidota bacterium]